MALRISIGSAALAVGAVAISLYVGLATAVVANQTRNPARAAFLGMGPQGLAEANLGYRSLEIATVKRPNAPVSEVVTARDVALARAGFSKEPLSVAALALLAVGAEKAKQPTQAKRLYDATVTLSRRSALANAWLVRDAARRDDQLAMIQSLSRLIKTAPETQKIYVPLLARGLERGSAVDVLVPLLGPAPPWKDIFWREVAGRPQSQRFGAVLRERIIAAPWNQRRITEVERELLASMTAAGNIDAAARLAGALHGVAVKPGKQAAKPGSKDELLVNADFSSPVVVPPFDWQLFSGGDFGGELDTKSSLLSVSALPEASGVVIRQLVGVRPGKYRVSWKLASDIMPPSGGLRTRLVCAENVKSVAIAPVPFSKKAGGADVLFPSTCRWYWFNIEIAPSDAGEGLDVELDSVSLRRVL
jgi:hypothetical protein